MLEVEAEIDLARHFIYILTTGARRAHRRPTKRGFGDDEMGNKQGLRHSAYLMTSECASRHERRLNRDSEPRLHLQHKVMKRTSRSTFFEQEQIAYGFGLARGSPAALSAGDSAHAQERGSAPGAKSGPGACGRWVEALLGAGSTGALGGAAAQPLTALNQIMRAPCRKLMSAG